MSTRRPAFLEDDLPHAGPSRNGQQQRREQADDSAPAYDEPSWERGHSSAPALDAEPEVEPIEGFTIGQLIERYPRLHRPVIDGLLREQETANIISVSKVGKSWLTVGLALSIVTGRPWLDRFATSQGRVLLIDNELHRATIASRVRTVAEAMSIPLGEYRDHLEVWPLRGKLRSIYALRADAERFRGCKAVLIDAKYRMMGPGVNENDNAAEAAFYNTIDGYAEQSGAAFVLVHHSSKGDQADKRITDVGAGAGAQSRAADSHLVLREHEEDGVAVGSGSPGQSLFPEPSRNGPWHLDP